LLSNRPRGTFRHPLKRPLDGFQILTYCMCVNV
jgi:hypothetical protein